MLWKDGKSWLCFPTGILCTFKTTTPCWWHEKGFQIPGSKPAKTVRCPSFQKAKDEWCGRRNPGGGCWHGFSWLSARAWRYVVWFCIQIKPGPWSRVPCTNLAGSGDEDNESPVESTDKHCYIKENEFVGAQKLEYHWTHFLSKLFKVLQHRWCSAYLRAVLINFFLHSSVSLIRGWHLIE